MPPKTTEIEDRLGTVFAGKYELTRVLGSGGMGVVYEARHALMDREVAVKVLLAQGAQNPKIAGRFLVEARAASRLDHPAIVRVFDVGRDGDDGPLYIVQELLRGEDLRRRLDREKRLDLRAALEVVAPIAAALVFAHERGVIHRDLKPENIFVARTDAGAEAPRLIDFGVSKVVEAEGDALGLTSTGALVGTPYYMSPEQARGTRAVTAQTDVWALGVVLYETLSGRRPFVADNYNALMLAILTSEPPRLDTLTPEVPAAVADVVHRALARDAGQRFATMRDFLAALRDAAPDLLAAPLDLAAAPARTRPSSAPDPLLDAGTLSLPPETPAPRDVRRIATLAAFVCVGALIVVNLVAPRHDPERRPTEPRPRAPGSAPLLVVRDGPSDAATPFVGNDASLPREPTASTPVVTPARRRRTAHDTVAVASAPSMTTSDAGAAPSDRPRPGVMRNFERVE